MKKGLPSERRWISAISRARQVLAQDVAHEGRGLGRGEGHEIDPLDVGIARCLCQPGSQRMLTPHVITAERGHHHHRRALQRAQEVRGRRQGPRVRPVEVLELDQERRAPGKAEEQVEERLMEPRPRPELLRGRRFIGPEGRHEPSQIGRAAPGQPGDGRHTILGRHRAEDLGVGREGQARLTHRDAAAGQHAHTLLLGQLADRREQAGLADPGLAADDRVTRLTLLCGLESGPELRDQRLPADQHGARHPASHDPDHTRTPARIARARQVSGRLGLAGRAAYAGPGRWTGAAADGDRTHRHRPSSGPGVPAGHGRPPPAGPSGATLRDGSSGTRSSSAPSTAAGAPRPGMTMALKAGRAHRANL